MPPIPPSSPPIASLAKRLLLHLPLPSSPQSQAQSQAPSSIDLRSTTPPLTNTLHSRQNNPAIIPSTYGSINSGPSPGTVVGIVLGSVGGFLLLLWLLYTCLNFGTWGSSSSYTESVVVRDRRKSHGSNRSRRVSETVEVRRERSPIRVVSEPRERVERVVVEERRETRRERSRSRGSDEVIVIEEHSPPRRSKSKKERREEDRRDTGFRTVDPLAYGGVVGGRKGGSRR